MTTLYMDGFDHYGAGTDGIANMLEGAWAQIVGNNGPSVPSFGARTGTLSAAAQGDGDLYRYVLPASKTRIFVSLGFAVNHLPEIDLANTIINFTTSGNTVFARLICQADGSVVLTDGSLTVLAATQGPVIVAGNWHFLEMDFNPTGGDFTLRVDDADASNSPAITATGLTYSSATVGQIRLLEIINGATTTAYADDLFIRDALGTLNNSWLGDRRVATLLVDDDTTTAGWSPRYYHQLGSGILNIQSIVNSSDPGAFASSATSLNVGNSDFTLETFVRFAALPTSTDRAAIFSRWDEPNNQRSYQLFLGSESLNSGSLCFQTSTDGTSSTVNQPIVYPWTPETDTWYNIALVRAAGELLLFVDGQQLGVPVADTSTYFAGTAALGLGCQLTDDHAFATITAGTYLNGWMDETRITNGVGRYTSNYTPTTVEYPRSSSDPNWADVVLLAGYDTVLQDESSFNQSLSTLHGGHQQTVTDGPSVGVFSTMGKLVPDDFTFAEAPFVAATSILTLNAQPTNGDTVTVGTTDGTTAAVYTFKNTITSSFGDVLIDTSLQQTLQNLFNAINAGPGSGTKYGSGTTSNFDVSANQLPASQMEAEALAPGSAGNSIATTVSLTNGGGWIGSTLAGGSDIPGPSNFRIQRLPPDTTLISAVQVTTRSFKSDAGVGSINTALVGPLGSLATGSTHSLTVSPVYYNDVYETDPDTSGPISPTTIINGSIQINRVT